MRGVIAVMAARPNREAPPMAGGGNRARRAATLQRDRDAPLLNGSKGSGSVSLRRFLIRFKSAHFPV
jgi:hypothetical protein